MSDTFSNKSFMNRYFSNGPAKTVEELKQKKKDMQLGKHRVKPGGDTKKFNKKIGRINKRIDNKLD